MGLGDADRLDDGDAAGGGRGGKTASWISCSICIEDVTDYGDRAWAKLQCGHQFHLDCIGSAFNVKGVMQCPNCRTIEKGQWLFAEGCRPYLELNIDDLVNDEDLYDLSYSESVQRLMDQRLEEHKREMERLMDQRLEEHDKEMKRQMDQRLEEQNKEMEQLMDQRLEEHHKEMKRQMDQRLKEQNRDMERQMQEFQDMMLTRFPPPLALNRTCPSPSP